MADGNGLAARQPQQFEHAEYVARQVADAIPQLVWSARPNGEVDYCNRRWLDYTGLSQDQAKGWGWKAAIHPEDSGALLERWRRVLAEGITDETEARLRSADGSFRWFLIRVAPLTDDHGRVVKWYGTNTDIDTRKRAEQERLRTAASEREKREWLFDIVNTVPGIVWEASLDSDSKCPNVDYISHNVEKLLGYTAAELLGSPELWIGAVHEEERERAAQELVTLLKEGTSGTLQVRCRAKDGRTVWLESEVVAVRAEAGRPRQVRGVTMDITERKRTEGLRRGKQHVLEMIASGAPLAEVLTALARVVEAQCDGMLCSVLLLDDDGVHLRHGAAPSLPEFYTRAIDGAKIGPRAGSCGTAAYRREPVIVTDVLVDPLWEDYRELARAANVRACWSTPIVSHSGKVLGTFAMYYRDVRSPGPIEQQLIELAIRIAGLGIERRRAEEDLRRSEAYLAEGQRLTHTGSWAWNAITRENTYWSAEHYRIFGLDPVKDDPSFQVAVQRMYPEDRVKFGQALDAAVREKRDFEVGWRVLLPDGRTRQLHSVGHPVLNAAGEVVEMVGTCMDVTEQYEARAALEEAFEEIKSLRDRLYRENLALRDEVDRVSMFEEIVGSSPALQRLLSQVAKVAPTDSTVLITGETGTGKELIARAVHKRSQRSGGAFVSVNCAALPPSLIASELFGHEKGAFTGALQRRMGRFELADGGTIFLDEVGELPLDTQVSLLRVLQERQFERLGGGQTIAVDVRVIAATNRDLKAATAAGTFRLDLFYRLNVFPIEVPALRDRRQDIPLLLEYFVRRFASRAGKRIRGVEKQTLERLQSYHWPGNIRELQNVVERSVILGTGEVFSVDDAWLGREAPQIPAAAGQAGGLDEELSRHEKTRIEAALAESGGRVAGRAGAAAKLGIPPSTLESKIRALNIRKNQFRAS